MRNHTRDYAFILLHCLIIFYFVCNNKIIEDIQYIKYIKIFLFLSLELLGTFLFFQLKKDTKPLNNVSFFLTILCFLFIIFLEYFGITYLEILTTIIIIINLPLILYNFMLFLMKESYLYFLYTILNLLFLIIFSILNTFSFNVKSFFSNQLMFKIFIVYIIIGISCLVLFGKEKSEIIVTKNFIKKDPKNIVFGVLHFLVTILLVYKSQNFKPPYYKEVIIFISFELFGFLMLYNIKKYIKNLKRKIVSYLFFSFFIIKVFEYLSNVLIDTLFIIVVLETILLIILLFLFFIIKKNIFYITYAIIELIWFIIFMFINMISSIPELSTLELNIFHILLAYIVVNYLYFLLFKENEKKIIKEENR